MSNQVIESLEQFLARGGQINMCPTRKCRGWRINNQSTRKIQERRGGYL